MVGLPSHVLTNKHNETTESARTGSSRPLIPKTTVLCKNYFVQKNKNEHIFPQPMQPKNNVYIYKKNKMR